MTALASHLDSFTEEESMVREAARSFCSRDPDFRRVRALRGCAPSFDLQAWEELARMGWLGARVPEAFGGTPLTHMQLALLLEQHGRSLAPEPLVAVMVMGAGIIAGGDNAALREKYLPALVAGNWIPALGFEERTTGGSAQQCTYTAGPGGMEIHGSKCLVPIGETAHAFIVSAAGAQGLALFLVPRDAPGLAITPHARVDGATWSDLRFDAVRVAHDAVVSSGPPAIALLERVLAEGRLSASAELAGLMAHAFEMAVDYLKVREQFGKPIGSFQALQHKAADLLVLVELSRSVLYQSAARFDAAQSPDAWARAASQAKARTSDAALQVTKGCIQIHGGIGYTDECHAGLFLKRAMVLATWLGGAVEHRQRYGELAHVSANTRHEAASPFLMEVRAWVEQTYPPGWRYPRTRMSLKDSESWRLQLAGKGWTAPGWPVEHGGLGLSAFEQMKLDEEFDRHGISIIPNMAVTMLGPLLIKYGCEAQKRKYLPDILSARAYWCQGYSEPGAGSDLASLRTRADLEGDEFVVNGSKLWTSYAYEAGMIFMLVRTDQQARKQEGISFLLADMRSPGITVRRIRKLTGESEFCEIFFDNVRVPRENLVGELNQGWTMAKSLLGFERIMLGNPRHAAYPLQLLQAALKDSGQLEDPVVRARFDALRLDVDDLAAAFARVTGVLRRGGQVGAEVSMLKVWITETQQRVADLMLETQGAGGTIDSPAHLADGTSLHAANQYLSSRAATIYGGSSEIQRNIIAKALLGLPG